MLKELLNENRFEHTMNVAERAEFLAKKYGADPEKARFAGLCHDICKCMSKGTQRGIITEGRIALDEAEEKTPALWHSIAASVYIQKKLGVTDKDIINAVRNHTAGRAGMSMLEKVVYIADLTSAERSYPDADYVRALTDYDIEQGIAYAVRWITSDMTRKGCGTGKNTAELLKEYENVEITYKNKEEN